jgi:L-lactate dehydrogenase complex protein LldG
MAQWGSQTLAAMTIPDTSRARRAILERIRTRQGRKASANGVDEKSITDYLESHPRGPQPAPMANLLERFSAMAALMSSSVSIIDRWRDGPDAVAKYLTAHKIPARAVIAVTLAGLDWPAARISTERRVPRDSDRLGISRAFCAVAETGTLAFVSEPETPPTVNLLPEFHIAFVSEMRIVPTIEDAFDLMRRERGQLARATNFISGPSRTGDIEQTIVLGAHGPRAVHIIVVREP